MTLSADEDLGPAVGSWLARAASAVLAMVAVGLGYVGFWQFLEEDGSYARSTTDVLYYTLQLFVLGATPLERGGPLNPPLEVARFLAPAATISAILLALQDVLRRRVGQARIRLLRDHVIVCGPAGVVRELVEQVEAQKPGRVVAITESGVPGGPGLFVLRGDPRDPRVLERAGVRRAREVFAVGSDSAANAEIGIAVHRAGSRQRSDDRVECYAEARQPAVFRAVLLQEAAGEKPQALRVEAFNRDERMARLLLRERGPYWPQAAAEGVVVIGQQGLGDSLVEALAWWVRGVPATEGATRPLRLHVVDRGLPEDALARAHAHLGTRLVVSGRDLDPRWIADAEDLYVPGPHGAPATPPHRVYICLPDDAACLAVKERVLEVLQDHEVTIVATIARSRLIGRSVGRPLGQEERRGSATAFLVNQTQSVFSLGAMRTGMHEDLAKAIHAAYVRARLEAGDDPALNSSLRPWDELPPFLQESNREQAWDWGRKLVQVGWSVVPSTDVPGRNAMRADFTPAEVDTLARLEHERWLEERRRQGWTEGPRNHTLKRHPDLVPWEQLDEESKGKDRAAVRVMPELLAKVNLVIVRAGS